MTKEIYKYPYNARTENEVKVFLLFWVMKIVFNHADSGKLWSAKTLSDNEMKAIFINPSFENLN